MFRYVENMEMKTRVGLNGKLLCLDNSKISTVDILFDNWADKSFHFHLLKRSMSQLEASVGAI